ncbi:hydantoinase/oxoprolinase family protein [Saccharopolyspora spinosa]|uniref:N-methylhydantoinase A n=1 Tax=Saccharopolyspora spinosa TaxID=60894 RepID=A0A2N3Y0B5_SACSN|nr:hydantoinase/oxoprolinase family protein [Saccharopolyspora spinosa]PKW16353.1 N-methylhydantoinase A [Saccharopolyspora spinosa]
MRVSTDMGGTFTDLVVEDDKGQVQIFKSPTTPLDPLRGVLATVEVAAEARGESLAEFLGQVDTFIHGTTRSLNAILTGNTARTGLVTTQGHPDILLFREGGRTDPFDFARDYPAPYVPRALTVQVPERIGADGSVVRPLDEQAARKALNELRQREVEAVAVCLLWSVVNPSHERRIGELIEEELPGIPYTLSHLLNPIIREYRRASSTAIDASLKPLMGTYLHALERDLTHHGFRGRLLINTSAGGVQDADDIAEAPIHTIGSGPAMAPVAGRHYARVDADVDIAIVADTGGTSYDVSVVHRGRIPVTTEAWLGPQYFGYMTGFPAVDVRSVGAGGGSIAWVDAGGMLRVGPQSAGAEPGPVCYARGGEQPTVSDACLVLGYIDPQYFLGGRMVLDAAAAEEAVLRHVGRPLGLNAHAAAEAILHLATEHMVGAIEEITLNQGIPVEEAVLVGGGGAAGFNTVAIARRLGCSRVLLPGVGAVLSAAGALMSDLSAEFAATSRTVTTGFDRDGVREVLDDLWRRSEKFAEGPGSGAVETTIELFAEARYPHQVWELEVPLRVRRFASDEDVEQLRQDFHAVHEDIFAIRDAESPVEVVGWRARVRCRLNDTDKNPELVSASAGGTRHSRTAYFPETGLVETAVVPFELMEPGEELFGPAIVESAVTTVVIDPGAQATRTASGSLSVKIPLTQRRTTETTKEALPR